MKMRSINLAACYPRRGMTLIEVVATIMLLSALLVGVLMGLQRHQQQVRTARVKIEACRLADQLVGKLFSNPKAFSGFDIGHIDGENGSFSWRMSRIDLPQDLTRIGIQKVRLSVDPHDEELDTDTDQQAARVDPLNATRHSLATLEVLLPIPEGDPASELGNASFDQSSGG